MTVDLVADLAQALGSAALPFLEFQAQTNPAYRPARLHRFLAETLEAFLARIELGLSPRLLVTLPPRHGKSELCSVGLPAYALGRNPDWPVIHASYTADLSNDFSRRVRNLLAEPEYRACFPGVQPARDSKSVGRWGIEGRRGVFVSTGVGGPITGRGAMLAIIDDPVKNADEADSEGFRQRQRDWYASTLYTRLEKGAGILLVMTRWHVEDLGGFVTTGAGTDEPPADAWQVVNLPARAGEGDPLGRAPGEPLWPEKYDAAALERIERQLPPRWWQALYNQQPVAATGNLLEVGKISQASPERTDLRIFQAWDLAISTKAGADYTAGATLGLDGDKNTHLLEVVRGRWSFNQGLEKMAEQAATWQPQSIGIETTGYQSAAFQEATRRYLLPFRELKADRDKATRAQLLADRIACGKVFADKQAPWWREFAAEALVFPQGAHDDQVDAVVYALALAAQPGLREADVF